MVAKRRSGAKRATQVTRNHGSKPGESVAQLQAERPERWTAEKETRFLSVLAGTANVKMALGEVGMSSAGLYKRRQARPAFRAAWDMALNEGYARLEAEMLARAINGGPGGWDGAADPTLKPLADSTILGLLTAHARRVAAIREREAEKLAQGDVEKLRAAIRKKLDDLARSVGIEVKR